MYIYIYYKDDIKSDFWRDTIGSIDFPPIFSTVFITCPPRLRAPQRPRNKQLLDSELRKISLRRSTVLRCGLRCGWGWGRCGLGPPEKNEEFVTWKDPPC